VKLRVLPARSAVLELEADLAAIRVGELVDELAASHCRRLQLSHELAELIALRCKPIEVVVLHRTSIFALLVARALDVLEEELERLLRQRRHLDDLALLLQPLEKLLLSTRLGESLMRLLL